MSRRTIKPLDLYKLPGSFQRPLELSFHTNPAIEPITQRQNDLLVKLIARKGKATYQATKIAAGIAPQTTITKLSKAQATLLISHLLQ